EDEYREFYKKLFHEYSDPLFWIHLNVDFPFNLKGILYFPRIRNQFELNQGKVKLFCNNVFVADDLKQIIPEFLLLLKGGIDIPDIPLNVSRSFLQNDQQVKKISSYIIKKIADSLKEIFENDRKRYEGFWEDIHHFIKFGVLTDEKFAEAMKDHLIFKTTSDDYVTIQEYLTRNKSDDKPRKVYYAPGEDTQVSFLNMMKAEGIEVIYANSIIDSHVFQHLESKDSDTSFVRIDSEVNDQLVNADKKEIVDSANRTDSEKLKEIFDKYLNESPEASFSKDDYASLIKKHPEAIDVLAPYLTTKDDFTYIKPYEIPPAVREQLGKEVYQELLQKLHLDVTAAVKYLKDVSIPAIVVFNEFIRRFQEMNYLSQQKDFDMLKNHQIIVNPDNSVIKKILAKYEQGKVDEAKLLVEYIHQLALLEQKSFSGKELQEFIQRSNRILELIE
ncbi:MAG: molecular chaperone HtpG, partial [Candidatus Cloacimonetes bacterium]|nr:molecular chaperone HtpG [Candidatus Cloacimonadota bacterium]